MQFEVDNQDKDPRLMSIEYLLPSISIDTPKRDNDSFDEYEPREEQTEAVALAISPGPKTTNGRLLTYEVSAAPLVTTDFVINASWAEQSSEPLRSVSPKRAAAWLASELEIDETTKTKLNELIALSKKLADNQQLVRQLLEQKSRHTTEQTRIRQNLWAVSPVRRHPSPI